jgi:assimilatory nitrate reductase catalytic subunit
MFWPEPRLFETSFPTPSGRARFVAVAHRTPEETPDGDYPLYLTTGRVLEQYQSGTQTRRIAALRSIPEAEIHPAICKRFGLESGGPVDLETRRGAARFMVKVSPSIREDTIFVPFHFGSEHSANRLTHAALDPTSKMPEFKVCAVRVVQ